MSSNERVPVVVCTKHKGVFFGHIDPDDIRPALSGHPLQLAQARMCVAWQRQIGGVLGLADGGPSDDCSIGATAPSITVNAVTAVMRCTDAAARAWSDAPCLK